MPQDLSIGAPGFASPQPVRPQSNQPGPGPGPEPQVTPAPAAPAAPLYPNPAMRIDSALNLLVITFHNAAGDVVDQTPSVRQLDAYQTKPPPGASSDLPLPAQTASGGDTVPHQGLSSTA